MDDNASSLERTISLAQMRLASLRRKLSKKATRPKKDAETYPTPRASEIALSDTIFVKVGPDAKMYTIHKSLLILQSGFFKGALSGNFRETKDGFVTLEDVQSSTFDVFVDWIYEKSIPDHVPYEASNRNHIPVRYHAYVLADRLLAPSFKSALLETFLDIFVDEHRPPMYHTITFAFDNLGPKDPLLNLMVDAFVINNSIACYRALDESIIHIPEMSKEVLIRLFERMHQVEGLDGSEAGEGKLRREDYRI